MTGTTAHRDADGDDWVPASCTLPTVEQPVRRGEFDDLFATAVVAVRQVSPTRTRLELRPDPDAASRAAALAVKETGCCSFFDFALAMADGKVTLEVAAASAHQEVLAALTARAETLSGASA